MLLVVNSVFVKSLQTGAIKITSNRLFLQRRPVSSSLTRLFSTTDRKQNSNSIASKASNIAQAAAATAALAASASQINMKKLTPPSSTDSFVTIDTTNKAVDDLSGLPLSYDRLLIQEYWEKEKGALSARWAEFLKLSVPFYGRLLSLFITDKDNMSTYVPELAKSARIILQELGPTFIKVGQMMSVRPDVLPAEALEELAILQVREERSEANPSAVLHSRLEYLFSLSSKN